MSLSLENEVKQALLDVTKYLREFIQGAQYWSGGMPLAISHCFLEKDQKCGGVVEISQLEDWMHHLDLHCMGCNRNFQLKYSDIGLEEIIKCS